MGSRRFDLNADRQIHPSMREKRSHHSNWRMGHEDGMRAGPEMAGTGVAGSANRDQRISDTVS